MFEEVNKLSVPFTDEYHEGLHILGPIGENPIIHTSNPENRRSTNIARPGHIFYPGNVVHSVFVNSSNNVIVKTVGIGEGESKAKAIFNNVVGISGFYPMHSEIKKMYKP